MFYPRYSTLGYIMFPFILSSALACIHQPVYFGVFVVAFTGNSVIIAVVVFGILYFRYVSDVLLFCGHALPCLWLSSLKLQMRYYAAGE